MSLFLKRRAIIFKTKKTPRNKLAYFGSVLSDRLLGNLKETGFTCFEESIFESLNEIRKHIAIMRCADSTLLLQILCEDLQEKDSITLEVMLLGNLDGKVFDALSTSISIFESDFNLTFNSIAKSIE